MAVDGHGVGLECVTVERSVSDRVQQVHGAEHVVEALAEVGVIRWREPDALALDLALCSRESGAHRGVRDEHRVGDLLGRHTADETQREGEPVLGREIRRAGDEQQAEPVVAAGRIIRHPHLSSDASSGRRSRILASRRTVSIAIRFATVVTQAAGLMSSSRSRDDSRAGERLLDRVLRQLKAAREADDRGEDARPLLSERVVERGSSHALKFDRIAFY